MNSPSPKALLALVPLAAACGKPVAGFHWGIDVVAAHDECHAPAVDYSGPLHMDYVLQFDNAATSLFYDDQPFAAGSISGCQVHYESVVWPEDHDGFAISWRITGDATWRTGAAGGCDLPDGTDWDGTETFEIVTSEDPDLAEGCTYGLDLTGVYEGEQ